MKNRTVNITFACPTCERPARVTFANAAGPVDWQCPQCDHRLSIAAPPANLPACAICGNRELYKKKAFPHSLGMGILVVACIASVFTYGWYEKWLTYAILIGTALFDGILYLMVGDVIVCYRCNAHHAGIEPGEQHKPHELIAGERYRQERLRREQLSPRGKGT